MKVLFHPKKKNIIDLRYEKHGSDWVSNPTPSLSGLLGVFPVLVLLFSVLRIWSELCFVFDVLVGLGLFSFV
jgi:hypothetical protein